MSKNNLYLVIFMLFIGVLIIYTHNEPKKIIFKHNKINNIDDIHYYE
jgi:hypothetical protein